jgi:hypothetical protein
MEHFSEQAWADFARGFRASANVQGIQAHLAAGCLNCQSHQAFWSRLQTMAQAESSFAPPENLVRLVKMQMAAEAAVKAGKEEASANKWTAACLLFNTYSQPLAAGMRGSGVASWHVVYEGEGLTIDLRFDSKPKSSMILVVGQILDRRVPRESMNGAAIVFFSERGLPVAATAANEFGEFHLECEPQDRLQLTAVIGTRKLQIPIANLK